MKTTCWLVFVAAVFARVPVPAFAQGGGALPEWKPSAEAVDELGEVFEDARIHIRLPRNLKYVGRRTPPELEARGAFSYGFLPGGIAGQGDPTNLSVSLTPFAKPSPEAFDKLLEGMMTSTQRKLQQVRFGETHRGRVGGVEVRAGTFQASVLGIEIVAYFLVGIDETGTFGVTAMVPRSQATPETIREIQTSLLTFRRADAVAR